MTSRLEDASNSAFPKVHINGLDLTEKLSRCFLQWPEGMIALDSDASILWLSDGAKSIGGWRPERVLNQHIHDVLCISSRGFDHEKDVCPLTRAQVECGGQPRSNYWLEEDGGYLSVDYRVIVMPEDAGVDRFISFYENRLDDHNFEELNKYAVFVDHSPAAITEFDCDGQLLFANPAMQSLMIDMGFDENGVSVVFPTDLEKHCEQCCADKISLKDIEVCIDKTYFNWHFHPLEGKQDTTVIGYAFDTTEQRQAELRAKEARAEARRDFYAKMMHELRTPLNAIVGYSDLVLYRLRDDLNEKDRKALRGIKMGGLQLNELISDTLDIAKIEAGKMFADVETFLVNSVVTEIDEQLRYLAEIKKLEYRIYCEQGMQVVSDRGKIRQILVNLISNAIKYTRNGYVDLIINCQGSEYWMLSVKDSGVGIPEDQLDGLFESYERVRESKNVGIQGTGLGLALVRELVAVLGGTVSVESVYGEGSVFTVMLPKTADTQYP